MSQSAVGQASASPFHQRPSTNSRHMMVAGRASFVNENDVSNILSPSRVDRRIAKLDHISRNIQNLAIGLNIEGSKQDLHEGLDPDPS